MSIENLFAAPPLYSHLRRPGRQFVAIWIIHFAMLDSAVSTDNVGTQDIVCLR